MYLIYIYIYVSLSFSHLLALFFLSCLDCGMIRPKKWDNLDNWFKKWNTWDNWGQLCRSTFHRCLLSLAPPDVFVWFAVFKPAFIFSTSTDLKCSALCSAIRIVANTISMKSRNSSWWATHTNLTQNVSFNFEVKLIYKPNFSTLQQNQQDSIPNSKAQQIFEEHAKHLFSTRY